MLKLEFLNVTNLGCANFIDDESETAAALG